MNDASDSFGAMLHQLQTKVLALVYPFPVESEAVVGYSHPDLASAVLHPHGDGGGRGMSYGIAHRLPRDLIRDQAQLGRCLNWIDGFLQDRGSLPPHLIKTPAESHPQGVSGRLHG